MILLIIGAYIISLIVYWAVLKLAVIIDPVLKGDEILWNWMLLGLVPVINVAWASIMFAVALVIVIKDFAKTISIHPDKDKILKFFGLG